MPRKKFVYYLFKTYVLIYNQIMLNNLVKKWLITPSNFNVVQQKKANIANK